MGGYGEMAMPPPMPGMMGQQGLGGSRSQSLGNYRSGTSHTNEFYGQVRSGHCVCDDFLHLNEVTPAVLWLPMGSIVFFWLRVPLFVFGLFSCSSVPQMHRGEGRHPGRPTSARLVGQGGGSGGPGIVHVPLSQPSVRQRLLDGENLHNLPQPSASEGEGDRKGHHQRRMSSPPVLENLVLEAKSGHQRQPSGSSDVSRCACSLLNTPGHLLLGTWEAVLQVGVI